MQDCTDVAIQQEKELTLVSLLQSSNRDWQECSDLAWNVSTNQINVRLHISHLFLLASQKSESKQSQQHTYPMCRTSRPLIPLRCTRSGAASTSCLYLEQSQEGGSRLQAPRQLLPSGDAVEVGWDISVNQEDHHSLLCQVTERLWLLSLHLRPLNSSSGETTSTERSTFHLFFIRKPFKVKKVRKIYQKVRIGTSSQPLSPHRGRPQMKGQHSRSPLSHLWLQERTEFKTC